MKRTILVACCFAPLFVHCVESQVSTQEPLIATVDGFSLTAKELDAAIRKCGSHKGNPYGDLFNVYLTLSCKVENLAENAFLARRGIPVTKDEVIQKAVAELEQEALQKKMSSQVLAKKKEELLNSINNYHRNNALQMKWYFQKYPLKINYSENSIANADTWRDVSFIKISKGTSQQQKNPSFVAKRKALTNEALRLAKKGTRLPNVCLYLLKHGLRAEDITWGGPYLSFSDMRISGTPLELLTRLKPKQYSPVIDEPDGFEFYRVERVVVSPGIQAVKQKPEAWKESFKQRYQWTHFGRDLKKSGALDRIQWHSKAYHTIYDYYQYSHRLNDSEIGLYLPDTIDPKGVRARLVRPACLRFLKKLDDAIRTEKVGQEPAKELRYSIIQGLWRHSTPQQRKALAKKRLESLQDMIELEDRYYYYFELAEYYAEIGDKQAASELLKSIQAYSKQSVGNKKEYAERFRKKLREFKRKKLVNAAQEKEINKALKALGK